MSPTRTLVGRDDDLAQARRRYGVLRQEAYEATPQVMREIWPSYGLPFSVDDVRFTPIDAPALQAHRAWPRSPHRIANFNWPREAGRAQRSPSRFELAVSVGETLCGLALGRPSRGDDNVTLWLMEANPGDHPLKRLVTPIVILCADRYVKVVGKRRLLLESPSPEAQPLFEALGFLLAGTRGSVTYIAQ